MTYVATAVKVSKAHPVLVDKYLSHAIEIDVDVVADGKDVFIGGIMEHIEEAGVHSGDATMVLPPQTVSQDMCSTDHRIITEKVAMALADQGSDEPAAGGQGQRRLHDRGQPAGVADRPVRLQGHRRPAGEGRHQGHAGHVAQGAGLCRTWRQFKHVAVKASVFPFLKLPGVDSILGPEMRSTGEVMGIDTDWTRPCTRRSSPPARSSRRRAVCT